MFRVFSDAHIHPYKVGQDRLQSLIRLMKHIFEPKQKVEFMLFGGDMFHMRGLLPASVVNAMHEVFTNRSNIPLYGVAGNHDLLSLSGNTESSLRFLQAYDNIHIVEEPRSLVFGGDRVYDIHLIPYGFWDLLEEKPDDTGRPQIFVVHSGVYNTDNPFPDDESMITVPSWVKSWDGSPLLMLFGHLHTPKVVWPVESDIDKIPNARVLVLRTGAIAQHNWSDADSPRGFYDIQLLDTWRVAFRNTSAMVPCFVDFTRQRGSYKRGDIIRAWDDDAGTFEGCTVERIPRVSEEQKQRLSGVAFRDYEAAIRSYAESKGKLDIVEFGLTYYRRVMEGTL